MKKAVAIGFLLSSVAPALAADPVIPDPVVEPPVYQALPMWTGLYIGGQLGWARGQRAPHIPASSKPTPVDPTDPTDPEQSCDLGDFAWAAASTTNTSAIAWADPCKAWGIGQTSNTGAGAIAVEQAASAPAAATKQTLSTASLDAGTIAAAEDAGSADAISYSSGGHRDTFIGGVHIGYNHQFENNLVLGAVADLNFLDWDRYVGARYQDHSLEARQSLQYLGTVRAKLGYAADRVLVYGTGGLAYGGIKNSLSVDGATVESDTKTRFGYAVGAGVDFLAFDNVSIGAEYLFTDLGKKSSNDVFRNNVRFHSLFLKASYHFK
ncbi:opacity protein-like surface antigen [Ochrobactrum sp. J50]|uniref:outer membrane protein n=1 Tax=Ochrobactrum sp. J50 TaxID=936132 RepID=UPI0011ADE251|nr:outer membrane protein [Ochrobactrum sp. J50]TWG98329.1 opacity protein-like surface antigen [Ochrobactrum sp. J50]